MNWKASAAPQSKTDSSRESRFVVMVANNLKERIELSTKAVDCTEEEDESGTKAINDQIED